MRLANKVAIVTGGARGIGQAIALRLAEEGAEIAICDVQPSDKTVAQIEELGRAALALKVDITQESQVKEAVDSVMAKWGRIDILVNNAGVTRDGLLLRMQESEWDMVLDVNLKGAFLFSRAALRPMLKQRQGRIISIASVVGLMGNPGQTNYAASKAGVIGFSKSLAREVASRGVTVNCVAPGFIVSEMTDALTEDQKKALLDQVPLGDMGLPGDVAAVVAFLASCDARYITGQTINVDGGLVMN
ncbi:MAG: 3-oxoacyl-[acyl-carrier-protein] reductase [Firmicutes bacterium]|mgnify:FL=1|nr:3-oxoacyl-[acyl-carrier-protein] reductase [Bacillota bacterium]